PASASTPVEPPAPIAAAPQAPARTVVPPSSSLGSTPLRGSPRVPPKGLTMPAKPVDTDRPVTSSAPARPPVAAAPAVEVAPAPTPAEAEPPRAAKRTSRPPDPSTLTPVSPMSRPPISAGDSAAETLEFDVDAEFNDDPAAMSTAAGQREATEASSFEDVGETVVDLEFERLDRTVVSKAPPRPPQFDEPTEAAMESEPVATSEGTVIARMPSPPSPWQGDDVERTLAAGVPSAEPIARITVVPSGAPARSIEARANEAAVPRTTVVPTERDRPAAPAPFLGGPPPGSTLVPGTTPPPGGFAEPGDTADEAATVALPSVDDAPTMGAAPPWSPTPAPAVTGMTAPHTVAPAVTGQTMPPSAAPAAEPAPTGGPRRGRKDARTAGLRLVMLGAKGEAVAERTLATGGSLDLGRDPGEPWADDEYIEARHVRLTAIDGGCSFQELVPTGAVFLRVQGRARMRDGDQLRVGQSLLAYDRGDGDPNAGPWGRVVVHHAADGSTHAVPLGGAGVMVGRELGEVTLPGDTFVSSTHCRVGCDQNGVFVEDLESSNGTYLRLRSGDRVDYGACVLVGQTQFMLRKR
ncbi:MAG: FHA domain-containing protein, partial [Nannocystaceae bacterium]|nr:FHA domain-containing protein [Nannocystaceae bacterium]